MNKYESFWQWFITIEQELHDNLEQDPDNWALLIQEQISLVHKDLVFDIPFEQKQNKHEFIISADGDATLFSVVDDLIECAPELKNWILVALRPRTNQMDQAIELDGLYLSYDDIFYQVHSYTLPLKLTIFIKDYDGKDQRYVHGYFLLFDTLIGERNVALYTETLGVHPYNTEDARPFVTLRDLFDELEKKELPQ